MRTYFLLTVTAFAVALLLAFTNVNRNTDKQISFSAKKVNPRTIIRCSPDWAAMQEWLDASDIPPIPGAGNYKWTISTGNDSAQFYFNQGINMYYGFHIIEAMASFKKAARFDPKSAMIYWAEALTYGPNINDFGYIASPEALAALDQAKSMAGTGTAFEKALVDAMAVRYVADSTDATRKKLNEAYTEKMRQIYQQFPNLPDAGALYADAMMLEHPWDLWNLNGSPKPWTPAIRQVLEKLLNRFPDHPGGNHYYIHVMEPSPYAEKALPSAARLGKSNPGLSHLVHMPSHIFLRTGKYQEGIDVNIAAVNSYNRSIPLYAPVTGADFLYLIHNLHMKANHAMLSGNYEASASAAAETKEGTPKDYLGIPAPLGNYVQYIYATDVLVGIRYGKWEQLLAMKTPEPGHTVSGILYHFGRGIAFSRTGRLEESGKELDAMRELMKDSSLLIPLTPFSPWIESARVAEQLLLGVIHEDKKIPEGAIRHFRLADSIESNMVYNEPRDWLLNPKHFLGKALLAAGYPDEAIRVLKKDLDNNRENGWALYGIYQAYLKKNNPKEAATWNQRFKKAFSNSGLSIQGPAY